MTDPARKEIFTMKKTAVIYWSGTGNTEAMANFVAEGAGGQAVPEPKPPC